MSYTRKRNLIGSSKKKSDPVEDELLALQEVDREACWKVYRLMEESCSDLHKPPNPKTKNCRQNPLCIRRLGLEKFDKLVQQVEKENKSTELLERRDQQKQPCGLSNFGNYCYVNSFLQTWFNDLKFRQCIYEWRPDPNWVKPENAKLDIQEVMNCLQRLFMTLQFTPFEATDANDFIHLLRLDNEQQDVQEFHTLFFDTIERNLELHPNGHQILRTIQRLFKFGIRSTVSCDCGKRSVNRAEYRSLQLSIDGCTNLITALQQFFQPEPLSDFRCDECGEKGWVHRQATVEQLPHVLIFQLNRYVFENNGRHRKLKNVIQYPHRLPITELTNEHNDEIDGQEYELSAVMIHEGPNTHCGHYYDLIRDPITGQWFKYNDKEVTAEKKAPGYVGKHPDPNPRGTADMKGCYALIYQRIETQNRKDIRLPEKSVLWNVRKKLENDFASQNKNENRSMLLWKERVISKQAFLSGLWQDLEISNGCELVDRPNDLAFLPATLLSDVITKEYDAVKEMRNLDGSIRYKKEEIVVLQDNPVEAEPLLGVKTEHILKDERKDWNATGAVNKTRPIFGVSSPNLANENSLDAKDLADLITDDEDLPMEDSADDQENEPTNVRKQLLRGSTNGIGKSKDKGEDADLDCRPSSSSEDQSFARFCGINASLHDSSFDTADFEHVYAPEPIDEVRMWSCRHGNVPLDAVQKGELKAVRAEAARRLMDNYDVRLRVLHSHTKSSSSAEKSEGVAVTVDEHTTEEDHRLRTGGDICMECVDSVRRGAVFRNTVEETVKYFVDLAKKDVISRRTHDPSRVYPEPSFQPPEGAVWVSEKHLKNFKALAFKQADAQGYLSVIEEEPADKRAKAGDLSDNEDTEVNKPFEQLHTEDIVCLDDQPTSSVRVLTMSSSNKLSPLKLVSRERSSSRQIDIENMPEIEEQMERDGEGSDVGPPESEANNAEGGDKRQNGSTVPRFNVELLCKHGLLSNKAKRVWLTRSEWAVLANNFVDCCEPIPCDAPECEQCINECNAQNKIRQSSLKQLQDLHLALNPLMKKWNNRKDPSSLEIGFLLSNVLCKQFIQEIRNEIGRSKSKKQPLDIPHICQNCLLCEHNLPFYLLDDIVPSITSTGNKRADTPKAILVSDSEWEELVEIYQSYVPEHPEPTRVLLRENGQYIEFCDECHARYNFEENSKQFIYPTGTDIYVKMKGDESEEEFQAKAAASVNTEMVVTRRGATKGAMKFKLRSDQTVNDLKISLYNRIQQSPADQLLYFDGRLLEDAWTLEMARIPKNNHSDPIVLIVQQRIEGTDGPAGKARAPEKGFKDTALSS